MAWTATMLLQCIASMAAVSIMATPVSPSHPMKRRGTSHAPWAATTTATDESAQTQHVARMLQSDGAGHTGRLRRDLLNDYDRGAFPWEYAWRQAGWNETTGVGNRTGLPVEIGMNFHRVFAVDIKRGVADLIVWFRQRWTDPRLTWDPDEYGGLEKAFFWIGDGVGGGEASEIWTPDITLWNMEVGLQDTLTDSFATVDSNGTVFWSRPGHLRPACKFKGLDNFPFDALSCTMEFGSWAFTGLYLRPVKMGDGFTIGGSDTAGESFSEYRLFDDSKGSIQCREVIYPPFPNSPEEDWPVLLFDVAFHRSWQPYLRGYVLMQVILNFCGFGAFWLPVHSGERMGLVITAMLAAVASELVVASNLPTASEMTWFQLFSLFSLTFAAFALFESVAVIYFFYYTGSDLVPHWWKWMRRKMSKENRRCSRKAKRETALAQQTIELEKASNHSSEEKDAASVSVPFHPSNDAHKNDWEKGNEEFEHSPAIQERRPSLNIDANDSLAMRLGMDRPPPPPTALGRQDTTRALFRQSLRRDADDFRDVKESDNNRRWQAVSQSIDDVCRVVIPLVYLIGFAILLNQVDFL